MNIFDKTGKPIIKELNEVEALITKDNYIEKLGAWLIENQETYFSDPDYVAKSFCDFQDFNQTVCARNLVMPNQVMLIDRKAPDGTHMYAITSITKNRKAKDHYFILEVSKLLNAHWRNGYFLLPLL